jgi:hypothetical protein
MLCYIISYDLRQPQQHYDQFYAALGAYDTAARVADSAWLVFTDHEAAEIRNHLSSLIDGNDELSVVTIGHTVEGTRPERPLRYDRSKLDNEFDHIGGRPIEEVIANHEAWAREVLRRAGLPDDLRWYRREGDDWVV